MIPKYPLMIKEKNQYIAKTFLGLEETLANELEAIGAENIEKINRGIKFSGGVELLYKANLSLRTALRILVPFAESRVTSTDELYEFAMNIEWLKIMSISDTFAIDPVVNSHLITHSKFAALRLKDAIADRFKKETGVRPSVNTLNPDYRINLHISHDKCTLSLDSSGESLHRRGYRSGKGRAPLNEAMAAGLVLLSGWKGERDLFDPMCGSGTIAIEAAMIAQNIYPGLLRNSFGFMRWKDFDEKLFKKIINTLSRRKEESSVKIYANDYSPEIIRKAKLNAVKAGVDKIIKLSKNNFFEMEPPTADAVIITNPPYGERLNPKNITDFYKQIGDTFKQKYSGYEAWILSGNLKALKSVGLKTSAKFILLNGSIDSRFNKYELYSGTRKTFKENA